MTSFEFFRGRCEHTKYFYCQIVLTDYALLFLENDLPKLLLINDSDILYFIAVWQTFKIEKNGKIKSSGTFRNISSNSVETGKSDDDFKFAPYTTYCVNPFMRGYFGLNVLYNLYDTVDNQILETYIPMLFENYTAQKSSKKLQEEWNETIKYWEGWKYERGIYLGLSREDKELYKQVENAIYHFDNDMERESAPSGEYSWFSIVWNSVQIVRNSGNEDDLVKHLSKISRNYSDEHRKAQESYYNNRKEAAKKIIELVQGG